jgi:hypothetical protein
MTANGGKTAEEILGLVTNPSYALVATARILIAPQDLLERHRELQLEVDREQRNAVGLDSRLPALAQDLADLEEILEEHYIEFRFRALSRKGWQDLLAAHPPTKEQVKADSRASFNPDTFPAAAIAACCVDPVLTVEQAQALESGVDGVGGLTDSQFNELFNTCVRANVGGLAAPKSVAAGALRRLRGGSGEPATSSESPAPSSLDG